MRHSRKQRYRREYDLKDHDNKSREYDLKDYIRLKMKGGTGYGFYPHKVGGTKKHNGVNRYRKTMNRRR